MAVSINKRFWDGSSYKDIAKVVFTSANFDSPATAGTRSHIQPGGKYIATWYEAVDFMYKQKENQDYFNNRTSMESFFGVLELKDDFDLDRDSSAEFKTEYNSDYYLNDTIDYIYKDKNNFGKVSTSEAFITVSGIDISFIVPDHSDNLFFDKANKVWWNSSGLNNDELLNIYIAYNGESDWHLLSEDIRNTGSFSFLVDYLYAKGFMDTIEDDTIKVELLPAKEVYRAVINEADALVQKGYATISAIMQSGFASTQYIFKYKDSTSETWIDVGDTYLDYTEGGAPIEVSEEIVGLTTNTTYNFKLVYNIGGSDLETEISSFTIDSQYRINYEPFVCQAKLKLSYLNAYDSYTESFYMREESFSSGTAPEPEITYSPEVLEVPYSEGTPYQPYVPPSGDRVDSEQVLAAFTNSYDTMGVIYYDKSNSVLYRCESDGLYKFDTPYNKWTFITSLPFTTSKVSMTTKLNCVYIVSCSSREFYKYDVSNNLWAKLLDFTDLTINNLEITSINEDDGKLYAKFVDGYNYVSGPTQPSVRTYEDFDECYLYVYDISLDSWELFCEISELSEDSVGVSDMSLTIDDIISSREIDFVSNPGIKLLPSTETPVGGGDYFIGPITCYSGGVFRHEAQGVFKLDYEAGSWSHTLNSPMPACDALVIIEPLVYLVDGNYFYSFNIVTSSWEQLMDIPANCISERGQELYYFEDTLDEIYLVSTEQLSFWGTEDQRTINSPIVFILSKFTVSTGSWSLVTSAEMEDAIPFVALFKDGINSNLIYALNLKSANLSLDNQVQYLGVSSINLNTNSFYDLGVFDTNFQELFSGRITEYPDQWRVDDCSGEVISIGSGEVEFIVTITQSFEITETVADQTFQFIRGSLDTADISTTCSGVNLNLYNQDLGVVSTTSGVLYSDTSMVNFRETLGPYDTSGGFDVGNVVSTVIRTTSDDNYVYIYACLEEADPSYSSYFYRVPFKYAIDNNPDVIDTLISLSGAANIFKCFLINNGDTLYGIGRTSNTILTADLLDNNGYTCTLSGGDFAPLSDQSVFGPVTVSGGPYTFGEELLSSCAYDENNNLLYTVGGADTYNFSEVDLSTVTYTPLADAPWLLKTDNTSCFLNEHVYVIQGPNSSAFASYSTVSGSWTVLASLPPALEAEYPILCKANNNNYLYLVNNNDKNMYVYDIANNLWEINEDALYTYTTYTDFEAAPENYFKYYISRYNMLYLFQRKDTGYLCVTFNVDTMDVAIPMYEYTLDDVIQNGANYLEIPNYSGTDHTITNMAFTNNLILASSDYDGNNSCLFYSQLYENPSITFPAFIDYEIVGTELFAPIFFFGDSDDYVYCASVFSDYMYSWSPSMSYKHILIRKIDVATGNTVVLGTHVAEFDIQSYGAGINSLSGSVVQVSSKKFELMITFTVKGNSYSNSTGAYSGACFRAIIEFDDDFLRFDFTPINNDTSYYDIHNNFQISVCPDVGTDYVTNITSDSKFFYMSFLGDGVDTEEDYLYRLPLKTAYDASTSCSGTSLLPWYTDGSIYKSSVVVSGTNVYSLGGDSSSYLYSMNRPSESNYSIVNTGSSVFNAPTDLSEGPYIFDKSMVKNLIIDDVSGTLYMLGDYFIAVNIDTNTYLELAYPYFDIADDFSFVFLNNYIYLSPGIPYKTIFRYDVSLDVWEELEPFPTAFVSNNIICKADSDYFLYLFNSYDADMYRYNISTNTWMTVAGYFDNGSECPEISVLNSMYRDGSIYFIISSQIVKFVVADMVAEYYFNYNYSGNNSPAVVDNSIYTNIGNSLIKQNLEYSQSDPIEEVIEIPEVEYVQYRAEIGYAEYVPPTYSGSNYTIQGDSPAIWEFSTDLTSDESVIMNFDVNFSAITGDGVVSAGTLMCHQFSGTTIVDGSATPIDRYHCGENSIIFEATFGEAYDCKLTAWDDDTHSTTNNKVLDEEHYKVDAVVYRSDSSTEGYNPKFVSSRSLVYPPCNDKVLKGDESYYGYFDFIYAVHAEDNGEFLAFIPRLDAMDETFAAGNYDFITTLHYEYT